MRPFLVVEGEKLVRSSEPTAVFLVSLKEPFDLPVRLRPSRRTKCVFDAILGKIPFKLVVEIGPVISVRVDE